MLDIEMLMEEINRKLIQREEYEADIDYATRVCNIAKNTNKKVYTQNGNIYLK